MTSPPLPRWRQLLQRPELRRIGRFLLVGGGLFALDLAIFLSLTTFAKVSVWWAQTVSVSVRTVVGFVAHKWFTFRGDTPDDASSTATQGVAYTVQGVLNVPISAAVVTACVWAAGGSELLGKVLAEGIMAVEVYLLYRLVVYRRWGRPEPA